MFLFSSVESTWESFQNSRLSLESRLVVISVGRASCIEGGCGVAGSYIRFLLEGLNFDNAAHSRITQPSFGGGGLQNVLSGKMSEVLEGAKGGRG